MSEKIRMHCLVSGYVQGVGFRYKSKYLARLFGLTGYVRNLYDGRVEFEIQGDRDSVKEFISRAASFGDVTDIEEKKMETDGEERIFSVL